MSVPDAAEAIGNQAGVFATVLCAADLARLLGISERTVWRLDSAGSLPRPIRLGRSVRWRMAEVQAWLEQGCPNRRDWESLSRKAKGVR